MTSDAWRPSSAGFLDDLPVALTASRARSVERHGRNAAQARAVRRERLERDVDAMTPAQRLRLAGALHLLSRRLDEDPHTPTSGRPEPEPPQLIVAGLSYATRARVGRSRVLGQIRLASPPTSARPPASPVFGVPLGSMRRMCASSVALGQCSTPRGTT